MTDRLVLAPGPVQVPDDALQAMAQPLIHHRTPQFKALFSRVVEELKWVFDTTQPVLVLTCSGTGGFESVLLNFTRRGEKLVAIGGGKFGERWGEMGRALGIDAIDLDVPWGESVTPEALRACLEQHPDTRMITLSHSETSTGVLHPLDELLAVAREVCPEALFAVDGITSVGVHPIHMDAQGIDILVSGSQKAFAVPPGLAFVAASERAWARADASDHPRYYFDLRREKKKQAAGETAFTPAISIVVALERVLARMRHEGMETVWSRHALNARAVREAMLALGLTLFAEHPADCVTSAVVPKGVSAPDVCKRIRDVYGITIAGGQDALKPDVIRMGHLGVVTRHDIMAGISALELALAECGASITPGAGVAAAQRVYAEPR